MTPEIIAAALEVKCDMCGAAPGVACHSIITGQPLERPVHYYRHNPDHIPPSQIRG